ncbi:hypothetical protein AHAS_Ahas05G0243100 [Arachis hypogaea]
MVAEKTIRLEQRKDEPKTSKRGKEIVQQDNNNYGPWMVIQRQKRNKKEEEKHGAGTSNSKENEILKMNKSRFSALEVEETENDKEA